MDAQPRIFFTGRYSYRKPGAFISGMVALVFGGFALRHLFLSIPHTTCSIKVNGAAVFFGGIGRLLHLTDRYQLTAIQQLKSFTICWKR